MAGADRPATGRSRRLLVWAAQLDRTGVPGAQRGRLAVATLWAMAAGTRAEDAAWRGVAPTHRRAPVPPPPADHCRRISVGWRGAAGLRWQLLRGRRLWLAPEAWPEPPPRLAVTIAGPVVPPLHSGYLPL